MDRTLLAAPAGAAGRGAAPVTLHGASLATTWLVLAVGVAAILLGGGVLLARGRSGPELRPRAAQFALMGVFAVTESAPRLAGLSSGWVLAFSVFALVPFGIAIATGRRLRGTGSAGSPDRSSGRGPAGTPR